MAPNRNGPDVAGRGSGAQHTKIKSEPVDDDIIFVFHRYSAQPRPQPLVPASPSKPIKREMPTTPGRTSTTSSRKRAWREESPIKTPGKRIKRENSPGSPFSPARRNDVADDIVFSPAAARGAIHSPLPFNTVRRAEGGPANHHIVKKEVKNEIKREIKNEDDVYIKPEIKAEIKDEVKDEIKDEGNNDEADNEEANNDENIAQPQPAAPQVDQCKLYLTADEQDRFRTVMYVTPAVAGHHIPDTPIDFKFGLTPIAVPQGVPVYESRPCDCAAPCPCPQPLVSFHVNFDRFVERLEQIITAEERDRRAWEAQRRRTQALHERAGSNFTSVAEIYAEAERTGQEPDLPDIGPPCLRCEALSVKRRMSKSNRNGNANRWVYECPECLALDPNRSKAFVTFGDLIGIGLAGKLCYCGYKVRSGRTGRSAENGPGRWFNSCSEGRCEYFEWEAQLGGQQLGGQLVAQLGGQMMAQLGGQLNGPLGAWLEWR